MSKAWFITGASSGFGRALAKAVLARGDCAILAARRRDALSNIAGADPGHALVVGLDVTDAAARDAAVQSALRRRLRSVGEEARRHRRRFRPLA
jgi:NADP-dependent 3-hydroxy acid dehydrogenase YdfG